MGSPIIYDFLAKPYSQAAIERRQEQKLIDFKAAPATVVGVQDYEELQCLDVRVAIDDVYVRKNNLVLESIVLKKVFVSLPKSGGFTIKQPVAVGDVCRLKWSHKDLGQYLDGTGGRVEVSVHDTGEVEDCWVELDGGTRKNHTNPSLTDFIIEGPNNKITITPEGNVTEVIGGDYTLKVTGNMTTEVGGNISEISSGTNYSKSSKHTIDNDIETEGTSTVQGGVFAPTYAGINGNSSTINADINLQGNLTQTGTFTINGVVVNTHDHGGAVPSMGA